MKHRTVGLAMTAAVTLSSCVTDSPSPARNTDASDTSSGFAANGQRVYETQCSSCHRDGVDGAPVVGRQADWTGRSPLWMAVLSEHAGDGYLQMPAQGSNASFSEAEIQAATEYMLLQSYPERLGD